MSHAHILGVLFITALFGTISGLTLCKPISGSWTLAGPYPGASETCAPLSAIVVIGSISTISSVLADFACAIPPSFILKNVKMQIRMKVLVWVILGLGASYVHIRPFQALSTGRNLLTCAFDRAAIATILRTPYSSTWQNRTNQLRKSATPGRHDPLKHRRLSHIMLPILYYSHLWNVASR